jgi:hypothetical protein
MSSSDVISIGEDSTWMNENVTEYANNSMNFEQTVENSPIAVLPENSSNDNMTAKNNSTKEIEQMVHRNPPKVSFNDLPDFNVTAIYEFTFSPVGVSIQLIEGALLWLTSSLFWIYSASFFGRLAPIFSVANNEKRIGPDDVTINRVYIRPKSSFKLIKDVKYLLFGSDVLIEDGEPRFGFGDVWTVNVTHSYSDAFSPDGVAIQMVQNFFTWFAGPFFWLAYIPLYERLSPIFAKQKSIGAVKANEAKSFNTNFIIHSLYESFKEKEFHSTQEMSLGKFAQILRFFSAFFDKIER